MAELLFWSLLTFVLIFALIYGIVLISLLQFFNIELDKLISFNTIKELLNRNKGRAFMFITVDGINYELVRSGTLIVVKNIFGVVLTSFTFACKKLTDVEAVAVKVIRKL